MQEKNTFEKRKNLQNQETWKGGKNNPPIINFCEFIEKENTEILN